MGFLTVSDTSCSIDNVTAFSDEWEKYRKLLHEGNTVLLRGGKDKNRGSFLIKKVEQLTSQFGNYAIIRYEDAGFN